MLAYKLVRKRRDGTLSPLFIGRSKVLPIGTWLEAEPIPTKGYSYRPGWHCCIEPLAPHLSKTGRVWVLVMIEDFEVFDRPVTQGGRWFVAKKLKILRELERCQSGLS